MKKILVMLLSLSFALSGVSAITFAEGEQKPEKVKAQYNLTFEEGTEDFYGFDLVSDSVAKQSESYMMDGSNRVLQVQKGQYHFSKGKHYTSGVYAVSMDFKPNSDTVMFFSLTDHDVRENHVKPRYSQTADGTIGDAVRIDAASGHVIAYQRMNQNDGNWRSWRQNPSSLPYKVGEWNNVTMYIDMVQKTAMYYVNNEYMCTELVSAYVDKLFGLTLTVEVGTALIDNFEFYDCDYDYIKEKQETGVNVPQFAIRPVYMQVNTNKFGNNYMGTNSATFDLVMENRRNEAVDTEVTYIVTDIDGIEIFRQTEDESFAANEERIESKTLNIGKYGTHTLIVETKDKKTGDIGTFETMIALVKTPPKGVVNPVAGIHDLTWNDIHHVAYNKDIYKLYAEAGYYATRSSMNWIEMETDENPGVMNYSQKQQSFREYKEEDWAMETMAIMMSPPYDMSYYGFPGYGYGPETELQMQGWYNFCYKIAKENPKIRYFEIWNEPNLAGFLAQTNNAEVYTNLLKTAYTAIKAANSEATVIGGVISSMSSSFTTQILELGAGDYMDVYSVHPYMWSQSPEAGQQYEGIRQTREHLDKYGYTDMPIWNTENGWQTYHGPHTQSSYTTRMLLLNEANDRLTEKIFLFRYTDDDKNDREGFGFLESYTDKYKFLARPVFCAVSNWNDLMTDAEFTEKIMYTEAQPLYRFKMRDGKDAFVFYTVKDSANISLYLGTDSVTVYDMYGNEQKISGVDGKYSFKASENVTYVVGNFYGVEKCEEQFGIKENTLKMVKNDKTILNLVKGAPGEYEVEVKTSGNVIFPENITLSNHNQQVVVTAGDIRPKKMQIALWEDAIDTGWETPAAAVELTVKKGDKVYYKTVIEGEQVDSITYENYMTHFSGNRWEYIIDAKNNTFDTNLTGKVKITAPERFAKLIPEWSVDTIAAGTNQKISVPIPDLLDKNDLDFKAVLQMSDGTEYNIEQKLAFEVVPKLKTPPTIDGVISDGEWIKTNPVLMNDTSGEPTNLIWEDGRQVYLNPWQGNEDSSAKIYVNYDDENFYMAAEVTDDIHMEDTNPVKRLWAGDGFQIAVAEEATEVNSLSTRFQIGLKDGVPSLERDSSLVPPTLGAWFQHELAIRRDEEKKITYYEFAIPFAEMFSFGYDPKDHPFMLISFLLNDRDVETNRSNNNREFAFQYGGGIVSGTLKSSEFKQFNLIR